MPGADVYDLREHAREFAALTAASGPDHARARARPAATTGRSAAATRRVAAGLVASDMHLGLGVPNTWYRARLKVAGSRGARSRGAHAAWLAGAGGRQQRQGGLGAYQQLWRLQRPRSGRADAPMVRSTAAPRDSGRSSGSARVLRSSSGASEVLELRLTEWGPLLDEPAARGALALRWTAHEPGATNLRWLELETVDDVEAALALVNTIGAPVQNFVCADAQGNVGWTLLGRIPLRGSGYDPTVPSDWTQPDAGWRGFLAPERYPRVVNPPGGRIWTANNRVVGGESLALIGDGSPDRGARAQQIRDALAPARGMRPSGTCSRSSSTTAPSFSSGGAKLLLEVLDADALAGHRGPRRAAQGRCHGRTARFGGIGRLPARAALPRADRAASVRGIDRHGADRAPGRRSRGTEAVRGSRLAARDGAAGAPARSAFLELAGVRPVGRRRDDCRHRARLRRRPPRQLQLGRAQYRQHSPPLEPRHPVCSGAGSTCRACRWPATTTCLMCTCRASAPPSASWCRPGARPRGYCTCRAVRAGIPGRRSTAPVTRPGCVASRRPFCPGRLSTR